MGWAVVNNQHDRAAFETGVAMTKQEKKTQLCPGCRDNFYNHPGNSPGGECWALAKSKVVERTQVGTWQNPPYRWQPQATLSCHRPEGRHWIERSDVRLIENGAKPLPSELLT